jgi:uncharacterized protein DUF6498
VSKRSGLSLHISSAALVLSNLIPLLGVLYFNWNAFAVICLFWMENLVIGGENAVRMIFAGRMLPGGGVIGKKIREAWEKAPDAKKSQILDIYEGKNASAVWVLKAFMVPFFCMHYGGFTLGHGMFVFGLFGKGSGLATVWRLGLIWAFLGLVVSHAISLWLNFFRGGEYRKANLIELMGRPYSRVWVMHLTVIFGAFVITATGEQKWAVALLVLLKMGADVHAHRRERTIFGREIDEPIDTAT